MFMIILLSKLYLERHMASIGIKTGSNLIMAGKHFAEHSKAESLCIDNMYMMFGIYQELPVFIIKLPFPFV